jgi:hypothetical protein
VKRELSRSKPGTQGAAKRRGGKRRDRQTLRGGETEVVDVARGTLVPTDSHHVGGFFSTASSFQLRAPEQVARQVAGLKGI